MLDPYQKSLSKMFMKIAKYTFFLYVFIYLSLHLFIYLFICLFTWFYLFILIVYLVICLFLFLQEAKNFRQNLRKGVCFFSQY